MPIQKTITVRGIDIYLLQDAIFVYTCRKGARGFAILERQSQKSLWIQPSNPKRNNAGLDKYIELRLATKPRHMPGNALFIGDTVFGNMAHALFDDFYRYWLAKEAGVIFDRVVMYDVAWEWTRFVAKHVFRINEAITYVRQGRLYSFQSLYFASNSRSGELRHPSNHGDKEYIIFARNEFRRFQLENSPSTKIASLSDKIFITRKPGSRRSFKNLDEIEDCFRSNNFSIILMEDLSVSDQILLMKGKKVIAGFYGAGFANAIAADSDAEVIMLISSYVLGSYSLAFDILGISYRYIDRRNTADPFFMPIDELSRAIMS